MSPNPAASILAEQILDELRGQANADNVAGMAHFGISSSGTLGISIPVLRDIARRLRPLRQTDPAYLHELAGALWASGLHEARILASFIDVPALVTREQLESWACGFDSWDVCDHVTDLFSQTPFAVQTAIAWSERPEPFVKRAGFVIMAMLARRSSKASDETLLAFLPLIEREATDDRNFVKKAVNWALRQIGKRSGALNAAAIATGEHILVAHADSTTARWIARDALRKLRNDAV